MGLCGTPAMLVLLLVALLLPKTVLALILRENGTARKGKLAVALSGGLRGFEECATSIVESFVKPNLEHFDQVDLFVVTWDDRNCYPEANLPLEQQPSVKLIQKVYASAGVKVKARNIWIGDHRIFHEQYHHRPPDGVWPYHYNQTFFDGVNDMWLLWQQAMSMVGDHEVVVRTRPDLCFDRGWKLRFEKQRGHWTALLAASQALWAIPGWPGNRDEILKIPLEPKIVYMGANDFHEDNRNHVPDDMTGFGLFDPMERTFGTMAIDVNKGMFNVTDEQYEHKWGPPAVETGTDLRDKPVALVNPNGAFVRERYPEKVLKHEILEKGYKYALIRTPRYSPYHVASVHRRCPSLGASSAQELRGHLGEQSASQPQLKKATAASPFEEPETF